MSLRLPPRPNPRTRIMPKPTTHTSDALSESHVEEGLSAAQRAGAIGAGVGLSLGLVGVAVFNRLCESGERCRRTAANMQSWLGTWGWASGVGRRHRVDGWAGAMAAGGAVCCSDVPTETSCTPAAEDMAATIASLASRLTFPQGSCLNCPGESTHPRLTAPLPRKYSAAPWYRKLTPALKVRVDAMGEARPQGSCCPVLVLQVASLPLDWNSSATESFSISSSPAGVLGRYPHHCYLHDQR